jgi:hypothetical protein
MDCQMKIVRAKVCPTEALRKQAAKAGYSSNRKNRLDLSFYLLIVLFMWRSGPRLMGKRFYLLSTYRFIYVEKWPSGQWQQTVNLSAQAFAGSNPAFSTTLFL